MYNVLVCDDQEDILSALQIYLEAEGYNVCLTKNGEQALAALKGQSFHLVLMDIMMPIKDGVSTVAEIRRSSNVPVIFLTAKSEDADKILGLTVGADDYITKPFNPIELLARVRSAIRRYVSLGGVVTTTDSSSRISIGGIEVDDDAKSVSRDGELIFLTPTEYQILYFLMRQPGKVFSSSQIYSGVWGETALGADNTIAVHIRHLREKLEYDPADPRYLKVVWGQGYKFDHK
ncbi:MAG: response regulator transcription factor [Clostridiaceae bacterium]|nr:response regulator transcription factor [Clostridiaceae bacterium]